MPDDPAITEPQGEPEAHAEASTETEARAKQKKTTEPHQHFAHPFSHRRIQRIHTLALATSDLKNWDPLLPAT